VNRLDEYRQEVPAPSRSPNQMTEKAMKSMFDGRRLQETRVQLVVVAAAIAITATVVAFLIVSDDGGRGTILAANSGAALVSQGQLEQLAESVEHPVYWAGPKNGVSYEFTETADGRIFVRYLPRGVAAGDPRPDFLTIGTYAQGNAFAGLQSASKREGLVSVNIDNGGIALFDSKKPTSVYFGYPDAKYQVEVFAPSGATARSLVLAGKIKPVE
jgi:hypothetical protein